MLLEMAQAGAQLAEPAETRVAREKPLSRPDLPIVRAWTFPWQLQASFLCSASSGWWSRSGVLESNSRFHLARRVRSLRSALHFLL